MNADATRPFNGVILIARNDQIIYQKASGPFGAPKINSQFGIASISKQFTATIILDLVDQGLIDINQPIKNYLPDLKDDWTELVTIKNLLNHSSGIVDIGKPLAFIPGSNFEYSPGLTFYLASIIAKRISKKTYEELLNELFKKANMRESATFFTVNMNENYHKYHRLAKAFVEKQGNIIEVTELSDHGKLYDHSWIPGGGIISTAKDLLNWNLALHNQKLLSQNSYKEMITASITRNHPRYQKIGYGLGIHILDKDGYLEISHGGYIEAYCTILIYYPKTKISVIILENIAWDKNGTRSASKIHEDIREVIRQYNNSIV